MILGTTKMKTDYRKTDVTNTRRLRPVLIRAIPYGIIFWYLYDKHYDFGQRFLIFLVYIALPFSLGLAVSDLLGFSIALVLVLNRIICGEIARRTMII